MSAIASERNRTRVRPADRFANPIAEGPSGFQVLHPTGKLRRPEPTSYLRSPLMDAMMPQAVGIVLEDGRAHRVVEEGARQVVLVGGREHTLATFASVAPDGNTGYELDGLGPKIVAAKIVPVSPWGPAGEPADMMLNFKPEWQKFHRAPAWVIDAHLDQRANTLQALLDRGAEVVRTGRIASPGSWRPEDKGLQTVMMFHDQGYVSPDQLNQQGFEGIRKFRQESPWDKAFHEDDQSASGMIAAPVAALGENMVKQYWPTGSVHIDQRGFTVDLPGYTVDDFRKARKFLVPILRELDKQLRVAHGLIYESDLQDVERFALKHQTKGKDAFDMVAYESNYFQLLPEAGGSPSPLATTLHALAETGELRHGFGQIFGASFHRDGGAQFEFSTAVLRSDEEGFGIGPNEMVGYQVNNRPQTGVPEVHKQNGRVPREQVVANTLFLRDTVEPQKV